MSHHSQIDTPNDDNQRSYGFISPSRHEPPGGRTSFYQQQSNNYQAQGYLYGSSFNPRDTLSSQNSQPLRFSGSQSHLLSGNKGVQSNGFQQTQLQQREIPRVGAAQQLNASTVHHQSSSHIAITQPNVQANQSVILVKSEETRDKIISSYREEIKVQPQRDRDYRHLSDLIADLQRRIRSLEGNLSDSQREHEESLSSQQKIIHHHQGEIESLKKTIVDREQEGIKVYDEIAATKREIEDRDSEIYTTSRDIDTVRKTNEQLRREIEFLQQDINQAQDVKKRQQQGIYQLKNDLRFQDKEVDEQQSRVVVLDKEAKNLNERAKHLTETLDQKSIIVERTLVKQDGLDRDINILKQNIISIDVDINDVERSNDRQIELQKQLLRQKDQEIVRSQDQTYHLRELEARNKEAEIQVEHLRKDLDGVRYSNDALLDRNHDLKLELESLNGHSELLTSQNRELQRELDSFVETDDVVRRNLDRKEKVIQIRQQVDEVIQKSIVDLVARSPRRARSPVKFEGYQSANAETSYYQQQQFGGSHGVHQQQQLHNTSHFYRSQREEQAPVQQLDQSQLRKSQFAESVNFRGSPLRRGQLEHQY